MHSTRSLLFRILKLALHPDAAVNLEGDFSDVDWQLVMTLAAEQGLIEKDAAGEMVRLQWIAGMVPWEQAYRQMWKEAAGLAEKPAEDVWLWRSF